MLQHASMTRWIAVGGRMPSARSANLAPNCLSVIGTSMLPIACAMKRMQDPPVLQRDHHVNLRGIDSGVTTGTTLPRNATTAGSFTARSLNCFGRRRLRRAQSQPRGRC